MVDCASCIVEGGLSPPPFTTACTAVVESPARKNAGGFGSARVVGEVFAPGRMDSRAAIPTGRLGLNIMLDLVVDK
jgi:hypothetical protein